MGWQRSRCRATGVISGCEAGVGESEKGEKGSDRRRCECGLGEGGRAGGRREEALVGR